MAQRTSIVDSEAHLSKRASEVGLSDGEGRTNSQWL